MTRILRTRLIAGLALFGLAVTLVVLGPPRDEARAAEGDPTDSAVTVSGVDGPYDAFSDLRVTVSQTENLTTQGITISWTGGAPTSPLKTFRTNFMQIMQCWGEPDDPHLRDTCQFGAHVPAPYTGPDRIGAETGWRSVGVDDPLETYDGPATGPFRRLPFRSVDGVDYYPTNDTAAGEGPLPDGFEHRLTEVMNASSSNEQPWLVTAGDGTGETTFWLQTNKEAPHLGCGRVTEDAPEGRPCTLVIVPRGTHNVNGDPAPSTAAIDDSPFSASNWAAHIAVPLDFQPVGAFCELGAEERPTVGTELMADLMTSWQPVLCAEGTTTYGFAATGDIEGVRQLMSGVEGAPGLAFTADAVDVGEGDPAVVHAPVAVSGMTIAFNIDVEPQLFSPPEIEALWGSRIRDLELTPRLVAKLLTQSYQADVPEGASGGVEHLTNEDGVENPIYITYDPEFRELNPDFAYFPISASGPKGLTVTFPNAVANREVWRWVLNDPEAKAWLGGEPDENGMIVNPFYEDLGLDEAPLLNFPKADPTCDRPGNAPEDKLYCSLDLRPYIGSYNEVAQRVLRADLGEKTVWDVNAQPPVYVASPPRPIGRRWSIGLTDTASTERYAVFTASLRNAAGEFVQPTQESMRAAVDSMVDTNDDGVLEIDPSAQAAGAYPLTMVTYAAVRVDQEPPALLDYAKLLAYAVDDGQEPGDGRGQLPRGYVPLPDELREQTAAAAVLLALLADGATATPTPTPTPTDPGTSDPGDDDPDPVDDGDDPPTGSDGSGPPPSNNGASTPPPGDSATTIPASPGPPVPAPSPSPSPSPTESSTPVARSSSTPGTDAGIAPYVLMVALLLGAAAAIAGPALTRLGSRFDKAA